MKSKKIVIRFAPHADATPIAKLVQLAGRYDSSIHIVAGTKNINAKSIMGMMSLALENGNTIEINADGPDEEKAIEAIEKFLSE